MYCTKCGAVITYGAKFCGNCGKEIKEENTSSYEQSAENQTYGQQTVMGSDGSLLKNHYAIKMIFSILEILWCFGCNILTMILGIIGCVFNNRANRAYQEGRTEEFKSNAKTATILLWAGFGAAVLYLIIILIMGSAEDSDIKLVQEGILSSYNYGVPIGDALHNWFDGGEEWISFEENNITYVTASGMCNHSLSGSREQQTFLFEIVDDENFYFVGAYDRNGNPIYSSANNSYGDPVSDLYLDMFNDFFSSIYGGITYEYALRAAFGDQEAMAILKEAEN